MAVITSMCMNIKCPFFMGQQNDHKRSVDEVISWTHCVGQWTPVAETNITEGGTSYLDDRSKTVTRKCELLIASKWKLGGDTQSCLAIVAYYY